LLVRDLGGIDSIPSPQPAALPPRMLGTWFALDWHAEDADDSACDIMWMDATAHTKT
jgi:hypothetical protein